MSFICRDCHADRDCEYHNKPMNGQPWSPEDPRVSWGPCEQCGERGPCVECMVPRRSSAKRERCRFCGHVMPNCECCPSPPPIDPRHWQAVYLNKHERDQLGQILATQRLRINELQTAVREYRFLVENLLDRVAYLEKTCGPREP